LWKEISTRRQDIFVVISSHQIQQIKDGNILSFFPIERAKALETDEDREINDLIYTKMKELEQLTQNALDQQEKIFKE
jgi:hypothetical protein